MDCTLLKQFTGSNRVWCLTAFSIFFLLFASVGHADIGLRLPSYSSPVTDVIAPPRTPTISVGDTLNLPILIPRAAQYNMEIDSTGSSVSTTYKLRNVDMLYPNRVPFPAYLMRRSKLELMRQWNLYSTQNYLERSGGMLGGRGITIETPEIKSKAFKRVFGGGSIGLKVTGEITIDGNMRNEKKSQVKTAVNRAPNTNFQMKQTQRFKVEGKIGENVSVYVDQDSERPFEFENAIKLNYSSDEDGIVQSIEAGNVSLSLPGTRFVTFSAQSAGLFGIKSKFKVGALDITAIASMEKGKKNTLSLDGGKVEETKKILDYQFRRNYKFFVSEKYRQLYNENLNADRQPVVDLNNQITQIEVFKSDNNYQSQNGAFEAWASNNPGKDLSEFSQEEGDYKGYFVRLEPVNHYIFEPLLGTIELKMPLSESEVLAVAYKDSTSIETFGDIDEYSAGVDTSDIDNLLRFQMVKPQNARPSDSTWALEWKNIYSLGTREIDRENFELKVFFDTPSGDDDETVTINEKKVGYLELFGLDISDKNGTPGADNIVDPSDYIIDYANGLVIFPDLRPFDPQPGGWMDRINGPKDMPYPEDKRSKEIYDDINDTKIRQASKFYIEVNSASRSPNLSLGINVIPESEEVMLNGRKLVRDKDYIIDYFSGQLTLLSEEATNPTAKLDVNYESQQMFSIDKKTLLGARAEYTFWEKGNTKSFIGATLLYMNQKTLDQRIRIGQQSPMRNIVWDVNTSINYEPTFIDKGLEKIPYLNATGTSSIKFEGEIAQIIPNPNTLNNDETGDHDGVAYLDDFEGAKRDITLGVIYSGWGQASIPAPITSEAVRDTFLADKGYLWWFNPYNLTPIQEIWPDREVTTAYGGTDRINVLNLRFRPNPELKKKYGNTRKSWGGIMTGLSAGYANQEDSKFLEIWVRGNHGRMHVDLGWVSEDVIPNNIFDSEDKEVGFFRNEILDEDEDTGIDGVIGKDPPYRFYPHETANITETDIGGGRMERRASPYDFWDLNGNDKKEPNEPWSYDDWVYDPKSGDYRLINGTEGNKSGSVAIYPNSEDLNGNTAIDQINDYFEYSFSLEDDSPDAHLISSPANEYGWKQYRIPLNKPSRIVGEPDWTRIRYARIWIDDVDRDEIIFKPADSDSIDYISIKIAEINLVGNEWKFQGVVTGEVDTNGVPIVDTGTTGEETFSIEVINTHEHADIYTQPPGVEGVIDPIQKIKSREQALVLKFNDLGPGEVAIAQKTLYQNESLLDYKTLKMFVSGGGDDQLWPVGFEMDREEKGDTLEFFLQLGSGNTLDNYYEIRLPVYEKWDSRNTIEVDFETFGRLKLEMISAGLDSIKEKQPNGHLLSISNKPSLSNIKWMIVGVKNKSEGTSISDAVWLNELRLSNVRKDKGIAMRARGDVRIADIFSVNSEYNRKDADFHTVNEQFGGGSNSESKSFNANVSLHKLLPASWGITIPVTLNYSDSKARPKWLPGSDILVSRNTVTDDSTWDAIQTLQSRKGISVSIRKGTKSRNFFLRYLVDPIRTGFSYSLNEASNSRQAANDNIGMNGNLGYSLTFGNQNFINPLKWVGEKGILRKISELKFYYTPTNLTIDMRGTTTDRYTETRDGLAPSSEYTATFNRTFGTGYKPFTFLDFDYNRTYASDMRGSDWEEVVQDMEPGVPRSVSQSVKGGFTPKMVNWFNPSLKLSANYRWDNNPAMAATGTGTNTSIARTASISGSFNPNKFVQVFKKKKSRSSGRRSTSARARRSRRVQNPRTRNAPENEEKKEDEEEKGPNPLLKALKVFGYAGTAFGKIEPVSITYTKNERDNHRAILDIPVVDYQFGLSLDPKVRISPDLASNPVTRSNDSRLSLRSGIKLTNSISVNFTYDFNTNETMGNQTTGNITRSIFLNDKNNFPNPFPSWSLTMRGLEKIKWIKNWVKSAAISHTFSGRQQQTWNDVKSNITSTTLSKDFRPFLSLNLTFKNGMTASAQYQTTVSLTEKEGAGSSNQKQESNSLNFNAKYSKKGGMKLPFFKKKLDNNIDFQMAFTMTDNSTQQDRGGGYQETSKTSNWSLKPQVTYSFTRTVNGGTYLELGERKDKRIGSTRITAFGINASISLSGR